MAGSSTDTRLPPWMAVEESEPGPHTPGLNPAKGRGASGGVTVETSRAGRYLPSDSEAALKIR